MHRFLLFLFLLLITGSKIHAQSVTLTREQFVGNWNAYMIMDTAAYFATPDSLKMADTLGIDILHFKMVTYHVNENGTVYVTSEYMKTSMEATWKLQGDTLIFREKGLEGEGDESTVASVRVIAPGRIELCNREVVAKKQSFIMSSWRKCNKA